MYDTFAQLQSYLLGVWRHRWLALALAWLVAIGGWIFVSQLPESYVATARIHVDTNSVLRPLMRGLTTSPNINERISMLSRTLLSRPNLEKLARMTDLDLHATTDEQKDALIKNLANSITLTGSRGNDSLYAISVTHRDRDSARRIAQALITVFIETSMSDKREDSSGAKDFLEKQLVESEARLIKGEAELATFKQTNVDVLPGDTGGDYYSRLQLARSNLDQAQLQLRELENRRSELHRQLEGEDPIFIASGMGGMNSPLDMRIQNLQGQLDGLLTKFTEKHPEIRRIQGLIAELEAEKQADYEMMRSNPDSDFGAMSSSPVYQGMRSMLAETQAQVAELRVRVAEYQDRVANLNAKVHQIPEVEAELKQLNRDYDVITRQHQQLLERRESARLSGDVEKNAGDITFRVIDPPFVPREPSQPNKLLLNVGVLGLALGAGIALALLTSLLYPIITNARMLAATAGLPLLGTVTYNKTNAETRRENWRLAGFSACSCALLLVFAGVLVAPGMFS